MSAPSPNRYAAPAEAMILRGEIAAHMAVRSALEEHAVSAATALHDTEVALRAAQEAHNAARRLRDYIEQQKRSVDRLVLVAQGPLHPIRRLPDEVLSMIFGYSTTDLNPRRALVISAICRRWRAVALSTRALWSIVHFDVPRITNREAAKRWALYLEAHCDRSADQTLDVEMTVGDFDDLSKGTRALWCAISRVYSQSKRFRVRFGGNFTPLMRVCLSSHAPHLEELVFDEPEDLREHALPAAQPLALNAPCLKTLVYDGYRLPLATDSVYHAVRRVKLVAGSLTPEDLANLFRACPGVVDLTATVFADLTSPGSIAISAQHLTTISLDLRDPSLLDFDVALCFSFPSLRTASLEIESTDDLVSSVLSTFIESAFSTVTFLELKCDLLSGMEEGLAACVQLEHLSLRLREFDEDEEDVVLTLSASDPADSWICPQLCTLSVAVQPDAMTPRDRPGFADAMLAIATARTTAPLGLGVHPLEKLDISFWSSLDDDSDSENNLRINALQRRLNTILTT